MFNFLIYFYIIFGNPGYSRIANLPVIPSVLGIRQLELASRTFSMEKRYDNEFVNEVFTDNILLTLHYLNGDVIKKDDIDWDLVQKPYKMQFTLNPGEGFAFHDQVLSEYQDVVVKTTNARFNYQDGFKSSGRLYGDGVCHLASFIHMAALDAGLTSISLARHDFAKINEVPREFGVSIKYMPGQFANSSRQNLYVINNRENPVTFVFEYDGTDLTVKVLEEASAKT